MPLETAINQIQALVRLCIDNGREITNCLERLQQAGVQDIATSKFATLFEQLEAEILFLADTSHHLSDSLVVHLMRLLQRLGGILHSASTSLTMYAENAHMLALSFSGSSMKESMDLVDDVENVVQQVEVWHSAFLQRLFLIVLLGEPFSTMSPAQNSGYQRSKALREVFNLRQAISQAKNVRNLPLLEIASITAPRDRLQDSQIWTAKNDNGNAFIIEYKETDEAVELPVLKASIRDLMTVLSQADPLRMGILCGFGFSRIQSDRRNGFELAYKFPDGHSNPRTLRNILLDPVNARKGPLHSITDRCTLAHWLARAVLYIHATGNVHKSVRPETILIFEKEESGDRDRYPYAIGSAYLVGLDGLRRDGPYSTLTSDGEWNKDIYRHPTRQGLDPKKVYSMRHDVYSLGVVLLEIALWRPFLYWNGSVYTLDEGMSRTFLTKSVSKTELSGGFDKWGNKLKSANDIHASLIKAAKQQVPLSMGSKFAKLVVQCLECLNGSFAISGDVENEDQVDVGIRYIEVVLEKLESISM